MPCDNELKCGDCMKHIGWQSSHPNGAIICDECRDKEIEAENERRREACIGANLPANWR